MVLLTPKSFFAQYAWFSRGQSHITKNKNNIKKYAWVGDISSGFCTLSYYLEHWTLLSYSAMAAKES